jgi:hypothetical protein
MSRMLPPPESRATGIGALPHTDPDEACRSVLHAYPEFPYIPTLPNRNVTESIVFNDSEQLPGRVIREGRLMVDRSADIAAGMEQIYLDFIEQNSAPYAISPAYGSGFHAMMQYRLDGVFGLKSQITGPVTFGMQVVDDDRRPVAYDPAFADVVPKMLALRARWCEQEMQARTGVRETLIVLNEPYFAALGSSVIPIDAETVRTGWEDIASLMEGGLGIHCCSNTDWGFVMSLDPAVLSFDAYANASEFLLYRDALAGYMERGGVIAWGIVPADGRIFVGESIGALYDRYRDIRGKVTEYVSPRLFDRQSLITPNCGIRFSDENGADAIMQAAAAISCRVREGS